MASSRICPRCHRPILSPSTERHDACDMGITADVGHGNYGDGYTCGHLARLLDTHGTVVDTAWTFDHPYDEPRDDFIRQCIHTRWPWATIDYTNSHVLED